MKQILLWASILAFCCACSRLPVLTTDILLSADEKWNAHKPDAYHLIVEMSGDRVEKGQFDVEVRSGRVSSLRRNGLEITPNAGQDYTMDGLFRMLKQEVGLAEKPAMLGAPSGYTVYLNAQFDDATGRLIRYRRTVGGTANSIEINVVKYEVNGT